MTPALLKRMFHVPQAHGQILYTQQCDIMRPGSRKTYEISIFLNSPTEPGICARGWWRNYDHLFIFKTHPACAKQA